MILTRAADPRAPRRRHSGFARLARTEGCSARVSYGALDRSTLTEGLARLVRGLQALAAVPLALRMLDIVLL